MPAENPSRSREFNLDNLSHDPEVEQVARGYMQYLKLLEVIKDVRSRSKLNQHAAIVSAGLVFNEAPGAQAGILWDIVAEDAQLVCRLVEFYGGTPDTVIDLALVALGESRSLLRQPVRAKS